MQNDNNYNTQNNYINNQSNQNSRTFDTIQNTNFNQNQLNTTIHSNNVLNTSNNQNNLQKETKGSKKVVLIILLLIVIVAIMVVILFVIGGSNTNTSTNTDNNNSVNDTIDNNDNKKLSIDDVMNAPETPASDFQYDVTDEGVVIDRYNGDGGIVVVPAKIEGIDVVMLGEDSFVNIKTVTAVRLPDTVWEVDDEAFLNCGNLEIFIAGKGLKCLGEYAFNGAIKLKTVLLNEGLERIESMACLGCQGPLIEIEIPSTVTYIGPGGLTRINRGEQPITVIGTAGSYIEKYVKEHGDSYQLVFQEK